MTRVKEYTTWKKLEALDGKLLRDELTNVYKRRFNTDLTYEIFKKWTNYDRKTLEPYWAWGENCRPMPWQLKRLIYLSLLHDVHTGNVFLSMQNKPGYSKAAQIISYAKKKNVTCAFSLQEATLFCKIAEETAPGGRVRTMRGLKTLEITNLLVTPNSLMLLPQNKRKVATEILTKNVYEKYCQTIEGSK